ncbi:MAG TPA: O-antigen ligase family protein [Solirubrobacteraceae bacterium]|nr:O-antigen ligase family protein [Solirubrobacteraceae bacterium]
MLIATGLPSAGTLVPLAVAGLLAIVLLAMLIHRRPEALPLLVTAALPFRLPISADGRTVNLLIPLYVVVAAGIVVRLLAILRGRGGDPAARSVAARDGADLAIRWLQWVLLGAVVLYVLQISYSPDRAKAAENVAFFYVPFGLLFVLLRDVPWTSRLLLRCLGLLVAIAIVLAGVGFVEYARKSLFLNPKLVAANQYDNYFRVNSVFFDPSIYGRFLILVMIAVTIAVLWGGRREAQAGALVLAWLLAGLVTSFSQSSIAALLLGLAVLAAWRWDLRRTVYASAAVLVLGVAVLVLAPSSLHFGLKGKGGSAENASNGRTSLIEGGLELFAQRPLEGFGAGSFETEYKRHSKASQATEQNATSASHTIPVTVAAEQGLPGLAVYLALLVLAFLVLFRGAGRSPPRIALVACFAALVLHTWTYADFLEDPFTWALLAIGVALARTGGAWKAPARGGGGDASAASAAAPRAGVGTAAPEPSGATWGGGAAGRAGAPRAAPRHQ